VDEVTKTKIINSALLSLLLLFFEPYVVLLKALGLLVIIDIVTGMLAAKKEGKSLTSARFWARKGPTVVLFLVGLAAAAIASPLLAEFGIESHQAGKWFCAFYGAYELFSVMENLGRLGMPIAKQFSQLLKSKLPEDVKTVVKE
jgi:phage-related holin